MAFASDAANFYFLQTKGFDTNSTEGLKKARKWLETTDPDNLMLGEPEGNEFDKAVGEMRRPMLLEFVDEQLYKYSLN